MSLVPFPGCGNLLSMNAKRVNFILTLQGACGEYNPDMWKAMAVPLNQRSRKGCAWTDVPLNQRRDDRFKSHSPTGRTGFLFLATVGRRNWPTVCTCLRGWCPLTFNVFEPLG